MWDEEDTFGRWFQGICAIFLALFASVAGYLIFSSTMSMIMVGGFAAFCGSATLCWRCARYALTGKGNVNRDDY